MSCIELQHIKTFSCELKGLTWFLPSPKASPLPTDSASSLCYPTVRSTHVIPTFPSSLKHQPYPTALKAKAQLYFYQFYHPFKEAMTKSCCFPAVLLQGVVL